MSLTTEPDAICKDRRSRKILFVIEKLAGRSGGAERVLIEAANALADVFKLTEEERSAVLPSGYPVVRHRGLVRLSSAQGGTRG